MSGGRRIFQMDPQGGSVDQRGDRPTVARRRLGAFLKARRVAARITGEQAAEAIRSSGSKISRIEAGRLPVRPRDVADLLTLYGVNDPAERESLLALAAESARPGWWDPFNQALPAHLLYLLNVEAAATRIDLYDPQAVPAVLQTPAYAQALTSASGKPVPWRGGLRGDTLARRRQLIQQPEGRRPRLWAMIDEAVLYRAPGRGSNPELMAEQIAYLSEVAGRGPRSAGVTVQIVPSRAAVALNAAGPFELLRFDGDLPDVVLLEHVTTLSMVEATRETERYRALINRLAVRAHDPSDSADLLRRLADTPPDPPAGGAR